MWFWKWTKGKPLKKKLVIVGGDSIGKTSLLQAALQKRYPPEKKEFDQSPGVYPCKATDQDGAEVMLDISLWDTAGWDDYSRLEPLKYPGSNIVLMAYAIDNAYSFDAIEERWMSEVVHMAPSGRIVLVGLRKDLRDTTTFHHTIAVGDGNQGGHISRDLGESMARRIGAIKFVECSSTTGEGIDEVFDAAAEAAMWRPKKIYPDKRRRDIFKILIGRQFCYR